MPRTPIPPVTPDFNGTLMPAATTGDPTNDHTIVNSGSTIIIVNNIGATAHPFVINIARTVQGQAVTPISTSVAAGTRQVFSSLSVADFGRVLNVDVDSAELKIDVIEP